MTRPYRKYPLRTMVVGEQLVIECEPGEEERRRTSFLTCARHYRKTGGTSVFRTRVSPGRVTVKRVT